METNDIKDIWKTEAVKDMKPYSEEELSEMVVKSVRKSINYFSAHYHCCNCVSYHNIVFERTKYRKDVY